MFGADLSNKTPLRFLAACYACPNTVKRLGKARLARFLYRHSRGRWGQEQAEALLEAAAETLELWGDELDYGELAEDIAIEARLALHLGEELKDLDERIRIQQRFTVASSAIPDDISPGACARSSARDPSSPAALTKGRPRVARAAFCASQGPRGTLPT